MEDKDEVARAAQEQEKRQREETVESECVVCFFG
jgi:hypothetical protein